MKGWSWLGVGVALAVACAEVSRPIGSRPAGVDEGAQGGAPSSATRGGSPTTGGHGDDITPEGGNPTADAGSTGRGGKGGASGVAGSSGALGNGGDDGAAGSAGTDGAAQACTKTADCGGAGFICLASTHLCTCPLDAPDTCNVGGVNTCVSKRVDPDNCGNCGVQCDPGAACRVGQCGKRPDQLVSAPGCGSVRLVIQAASVFFTESGTGRVRRVPLAGGAVTDIAVGQASPTQIAADADAVYWVNHGDGGVGSSRVMKQALGAAQPIALKIASGTETLPALAVHAGKLYYAQGSEVHQISTDEQQSADVVVGISVNYDDPLTPMAYGQPRSLAVNDNRVLWASGDRNAVESHPLTPVVDVNDSTGYAKLGKSIGSLLFSGDLGIDVQYGYWANGESIERNAVDAASPVPEIVAVAPTAAAITTFVIDEFRAYFAASDGQVFEELLPLSGPNDDGVATPIARDQPNATSLVLSDGKVYWATSDCAIRSVGL